MSAHSSLLRQPDEVSLRQKSFKIGQNSANKSRVSWHCEIELMLSFVQLADLHIFVVPLELWLEKYRTAFNNIALESVSAGFVR